MTPTAYAKKSDLDNPLTGGDYRRIASLIGERKKRQCEALKLYRPLPTQQRVHESKAYIRLLVGGNRSGKTRAACVEFARCVTNQDPFKKYPRQGKVYVVGKSLKHIGDTLYPILFKAGAFKMIRDLHTGEWRTFHPWEPADQQRIDEVKPMPPLIPERFIASRAWQTKSRQELSRMTFTTGWEVVFFSAEGKMPQGSNVNLVWFDEEIGNSPDGEWFPEMTARLMDDQGVFMWSATPQAGFEQLFDLYQKAEFQQERFRLDPVNSPKPDIEAFSFDLGDNPHIGKKEKERFFANLTADQAQVRGSGEFTISAQRMYPEFQLAVHGYPMTKPVGDDWRRYVYVDPGFAVCAVLFAAVPPKEECPDGEPIVLLYDELYIQQCNAALFGMRMKEKCENTAFEAFYLDYHGAPSEAGSGRSIRDQYCEALAKNGVQSRLSGHQFFPGDPDRKAGWMAVHGMLAVRKVGGPRLRIAVSPTDPTLSLLPNLCYEMRRYRKKKVKGVILDEADDRGPTHLCQCVRYMAMSDPEWREIPKPSKRTPMDDMFDYIKSRERARSGGTGSFNFGPGN